MPLVLEAGAGSGKTSTLVGRILSWSLNQGWEAAAQQRPDADRRELAARVLDRIVAITFTEAAASEMAERVLEAFGALAQDRVPLGFERSRLPPDSKTRAAALLEVSDRLAVCTIHAYCQRLLRRFPLASQTPPAAEIDASGLQRARVLRNVLEESLTENYREPLTSELLELASHRIGPHEIESELESFFLAGGRAEALSESPLSSSRLEAWRAHAMRSLAALRQSGLVEIFEQAKPGSPSASAAQSLLELDAELGEVDEAEIAARVGGWPKRLLDRLSSWGRAAFIQRDRSILGERSDAFAASTRDFRVWLRGAQRFDPGFLETARSVLLPLAVETEAEFRREGIQSFDDMLRDAHRLLRDNREVRTALQRSIDLILVDEFQDTDRIQCELVQLIALSQTDAPRPSLFVVGDPKQSIYGWRNADLVAYENFVAKLERAGGRRHRLHRCFRSRPQLLDQIELWMRACMLRAPGVQPAFEPLVATRDDSSEAPCVEVWLDWLPSEDQAAPLRQRAWELAATEAQRIATDLLERKSQLRWSKVGILLRSRGELDCYLDALRDAGIPFKVEGDRAYYRRREVIELAALIRCVLDPADHISLLAWLRSIHVGLPDAALIPLWSREFPARMTALDSPDARELEALESCLRDAAAALPSDAPGLDRINGWETVAMQALRDLAQLRWSFWNEPADSFVEQVRRLTLVEATEAGRYLGRHRLANVERFLRELEDDLGQEVRDTESLLRNLRRRLRRADPEEEGRPTEELEDAVHVCTIHQAKGLEFDHVYLAQTHKTSSQGEPGAEPGEVDGNWEYALFGCETAGFGRLREQRTATADAELVRTLYVAMTRARDRLVLLGDWGFEPNAGARPARMRHHADLLRCRVLTDAQPEQLFRSGRTQISSDGILWRFPTVGAAALERKATAREMPVNDTSFLQSRADAARVESLRELARQRQATPLAVQASRLGEAERDCEAATAGSADGARIGTAVHLALEAFDASLPLDSLRTLLLERALEAVQASPLVGREGALARVRNLVDAFFESPLASRRLQISEHAATEVPALLDAQSLDVDAAGHVAGVIDLLYNDPETGAWVVADYKTDAVDGPDSIDRLCRRYAPQGQAYTRAVQQALELSEPPRFELWLLSAGRIVEVAPLHSASP